MNNNIGGSLSASLPLMSPKTLRKNIFKMFEILKI